MSKRKAADCATTSTPDITKLKEEYLHRYVTTPLKFWKDGEWEIEDTDTDIIEGQIVNIKMVKNRKKDVVAAVWYEPTDKEEDTVCEIKLDIVRNMLLPRNHTPAKNSFFYDEPKIGGEDENSGSDEDSSMKRQRTEQDSDEEVNESTGAILRDEDTEGDNEDNENEESSDSDSNSDSDGSIDGSKNANGEESGSDTETEDEEILTSCVVVKWRKGEDGEHIPLPFEGPISNDATDECVRNGMANKDFFVNDPDPIQCFFAFLPISYFDKVASWTENKLKEKEVTGYEEIDIRRDDILGLIAMWFIFGLVALPSSDMYFNVGIGNILTLLKIEVRDEQHLPKRLLYNQLASAIQWNEPVPIGDRIHPDGRADALYLIRPLLDLMQENFPKAWVPSVNLTVDESLWAFKGRTFLKRFMKDKPKKYGFLQYALCTLGGYFYCVLVHHVPGKQKRMQRKLDETNLDKDACLQLKLQKRYGEQGALVVRLASMLQYDGHHIIGDNAFSSVQLAVDLRNGSVPGAKARKADYTGTQVMMAKKAKSTNAPQMNFAEYRNLPTEGWGRIKKYHHEWYSDDQKSVSVVRFHDKRHITLISTRHHGSSISQADRTRNKTRIAVQIPTIVKEYSYKKVGVDVGDQQLRNKVSYADNIRCKGWSRKWGMHAIQQCRHNAFLCWKDIHGFKTGKEDKCAIWSDKGTGSSKILWAFQIGLIKGLLAHVRQFRRSIDTRSRTKYIMPDEIEIEHTIVNRGTEFRNVRCAVCSFYAQEDKKSIGTRQRPNRKIGRTAMWCPHPSCRAHACKEHRNDIHRLSLEGVNLAKFHNESRVAYTQKNPGRHKKPEGSGRQTKENES